MALFKHDRVTYLDLSTELRDMEDFKLETLRTLEYHLDVVALAVDPVHGLLATGTTSGVIHLFGGTGVDLSFTISDSLSIKFIQFAIPLFKLVCIDSSDRLHLYDLSSYGRPKLQHITRFNSPINSITLSPSHSHAFLALGSGEIKTYDILCHQKSPYSIPNMWTLYEKKITASGLGGQPTHSNPDSQVPMDVIIHPRDLNLVFVVYGGGIVLSDLTHRNTLRVYEYTIMPGAPGGAGYANGDIMNHRRPTVTAMAIHPAGHFFAAGYADGSIAFWAIEDEDQPFLVRTVDDIDVHVVDGIKLEEHFSNAGGESQPPAPSIREPIFKLAWSGFSNSPDPRGGETALTILGGLENEDSSGVTVQWLPPFNPADPPASPSTNTNHPTLHPHTRNAMRQSVLPSKTFFYSTSGTTQDFLLVPKDSPHFANAYDPTSIVFLSEAEGRTRAVEAFEFPPPEFSVSLPPAPGEASDDQPADDIAEDLAATLESMKMSIGPTPRELPSALWSGPRGVVHGQLLKIDRFAYKTLVEPENSSDNGLGLSGGFAWTDASHAKLAKYEPNRILVTHHRDLSIHFQDLSAQILVNSENSPVQFDFPRHLPGLTIDVSPLLTEAAIVKRTSPRFCDDARTEFIRLATDSLEIVTGFKSGELLVYRLRATEVPRYREAADPELIILEHVPQDQHKRYHPYFMFAAGRGAISACEISDIGFLAVAFSDGSLFIVDLRGPSILFRSVPDEKAKHRHSIGLHLRPAADEPVKNLVWTVSRLGTDTQLQVRLIAIQESGNAKVFTVKRSVAASWTVQVEMDDAEGMSHPVPRGSFVIDSVTGLPCKADGTRLAATGQTSRGSSIESHNVWISCGAKGAKSVGDITGDRVAKIDWGSKHGNVRSTQLIEHNGSHALLAINDKPEGLIYSLPHLELIQALPLPQVSNENECGADETGAYIEWMRHRSSALVQRGIFHSLFDLHRAYAKPEYDLTVPKRSVPSQPQPVSTGLASLLGSWFKFNQTMTGDQIDALLAGPDRPIPEPVHPPAVQGARAAGTSSDSAYAALKAAQGTGNDIYARLSAAVSERGQKLGDLEDSFNSLEAGSRNMVSEAKKLAATQSAKRWFDI
ncbi:hypothetical protein PLICRDRAFT_36534 [Plicaturopsis crispa FD-325 SS-3]|nr:hypothetical protein PLICRDRAFT_36534 [Plicaturopsis crispa FD-325 SS-3]